MTEAQQTMERVVREHNELNAKLEREFKEKDRRLQDSLRA